MTTEPEVPEAQGGWWSRRSTFVKILIIGGGVLLVFIIIGALTSGSGDDIASGETTTTAGGDETTTTTEAETTTTAGGDETTTTTEADSGSPLTFGDGSWIVGTDIEAGTYRNDDSSNLCLWQRLSGFGGETGDIIAGDLTEAITIVTIKDSDAGFDSQDCGTWSSDLSPRTNSPDDDFSDGTWIVGSDIAPGLWRNDDSSNLCLWQRLSGFSGDIGDIITGDLTEATATVQIDESDVGFAAQDCGTWTKIG